MEDDINRQQDEGEPVPGKRVFEMPVRYLDTGLASHGIPAGIGRRIRDENAIAHAGQAGGGGHGPRIGEKPDAPGGFVIRHPATGLARYAKHPGHCRFSRNLSPPPCFRIGAVERDPAPIDEDEVAGTQAKRRHDFEARPPTADAVADQELAGMEKPALRHGPSKGDIVICRGSRIDRYRRQGEPRLPVSDHAFLPVQAMNLPGAETDEDGEREHRRDGRPERRTKAPPEPVNPACRTHAGDSCSGARQGAP